MRGDDQLRSAASAAPDGDDVAFLVDARIAEAERDQALLKILRTYLLLEGRRWNHDDRFLIRQRLRVVGLNEIDRLFDLGVAGHGGELLFDSGRDVRLGGERRN